MLDEPMINSVIFKQLAIGDHFLLTEDGETCKKTSINQYKSVSDSNTIHLIAPMTKVFQKEIDLWLIRDDREEGLFAPRKIVCLKVEGNTYHINEFPYKITINAAYGQENGLATGFDVWRWSYFVCLSESVASQLYQKLQNEFHNKRISKEYATPTA